MGLNLISSTIDPSHKINVRFRGQEDQSSSTKVPSLVCYDTDGNLKARGAEMKDPETAYDAVEGGWHVVEWWVFLITT